jgi:hypothetical protein
MPTWTTVADRADAALPPAWFIHRMASAGDGSFGLLLTTGDVLRVISIAAAHLSTNGTVLLDVVLDHAGVPDVADTAWRSKHYLGAPVPNADRATVNLAHVVTAVEFNAPFETAPVSGQEAALADAEATVGELRHAAEDAAKWGSVE